MRIGLLTGGGDCAGLNAAIRSAVRAGSSYGDEFLGFHHGWRGVVENEFSPLTPLETKGILQSGGTILRSARFHPQEHDGGVAAVISNVERNRLDALIVIGGDVTTRDRRRLSWSWPKARSAERSWDRPTGRPDRWSRRNSLDGRVMKLDS